jgi:hypothetical protein
MSSTFELRPGQGSAFKNKDKTEDWHADYKGELMMPDGTLHWIDVQPGKTRAGEWWFKIKLGKPKQARQTGQQQGMVLDVRYGAPSNANGQPYPRPQAHPVFAAPAAKPIPAANAVASMDDDIPF